MDSDFKLSELVEMENMFRERGEEAVAPEFCQEVANSFSYAPTRAGKEAITMEQVRSWFWDRLRNSHSSNMALKLFIDHYDASTSFSAPENSQKSKGTAADLLELMFEAQSSKDDAWYDVACFLNYRFVSSGELEVRVRFAGYRNTDDEWVNVRSSVRKRSIPLESSECQRVNIGDLVLCFQEREEKAVYYDACVMEIQRQLHDTGGCTCVFVVRYYHDSTEEKVGLDRLCCRPI